MSTTITVPRLPPLALLGGAAVTAVLGALSLFVVAPRLDGFVGGFFVGVGCTLLVAVGVMLAPLLWARLPEPPTAGWRPSTDQP